MQIKLGMRDRILLAAMNIHFTDEQICPKKTLKGTSPACYSFFPGVSGFFLLFLFFTFTLYIAMR